MFLAFNSSLILNNIFLYIYLSLKVYVYIKLKIKVLAYINTYLKYFGRCLLQFPYKCHKFIYQEI